MIEFEGTIVYRTYQIQWEEGWRTKTSKIKKCRKFNVVLSTMSLAPTKDTERNDIKACFASGWRTGACG